MAKRRRFGQFDGPAYYAPRFHLGSRFSQKTKASVARIDGGVGMAPDALYTKLYWAATYPCTAAPANRFVIVANGLFDPGFTTGATQPAGFDQWAALYAGYRVLWSKIEVQFVSRTTADAPYIISVYPSISSNPFSTTAPDNAAQSGGKSYVTQAGLPNWPMRCFNTTKKMFGDRNDNDTVYQAQVSANPGAAWYWICDRVTADGTNGDPSDFFLVKVEFGVRWEGRKQLALS